MIRKYLAVPVMLAVLASCASPAARERARQSNAAERFLERAGTIGDPGRVAAADIAFARMARDEGQWTAFLEYAAPGAQLHGRNGLIAAQPWLAEQENPPVSVAWTPSDVWSSCDGTMAVSIGRFQEPEGIVGSYVTVWEWQDGGGYKWVYDMGAPDNPQPAPRPELDIPDDAIIVPGMTAINGRVADCPGDQAFPLAPETEVAAGVDSRSRQSKDFTLQWRWEHHDDGTRRVVVEYLRSGQWEQVLDFTAPEPLEG